MSDSYDPKMPNRTTSYSYGTLNPTAPLGSRISFYTRIHARAILATLGFVCFVIIMTSGNINKRATMDPTGLRQSKIGAPFLRNNNFKAHFGGAFHEGYFMPQNAIIDPNTFRFAAVTDLDQLSHVADSKKPTFQSLLLPGVLVRDPNTNRYSITLEPSRMLYSQHNEGGRGMELSELTLFQNRLLAFDDRTGTVFELLSREQGKESIVVPRLVITEGDGDTDKGMKWEWATVKDNYLYMGSMGKEYTNPDGSVANTNNLWIVIVSPAGEVQRVNWTAQYNFVREKIGAASPGYMINEAVLWSQHLRKWVFLPRRISSEMYDEVKDERMGANKIIFVDEGFTSVEVVDIKFPNNDPLHGFSTFAFVPGTEDRHAFAVRSVEEDCVGGDESLCKQRSYFTVFDVITGDVLMDEEQINVDMDVKFEGVEFVDIHTPEPY